VVAADTPLVAATADTVQVARAPVEAAPEAPPPPKVEEPVTEPKGYAGYLRNPAPDYPPAAQKRGLEGKVVLKVHVLASGQPDNVTVAKSSGHQILDDAALKAVTQWAFAPARRGQTPIDGWVQVPLTFKI
jgi:protein TonB